MTFTATFTAPAVDAAPMTGTVAFYDGATYLGTAPLVSTIVGLLRAKGGGFGVETPIVSGVANLPTSSSVGRRPLDPGRLLGDAHYSPATSETQASVQVLRAVTDTTLTATPSSLGTLLTATVVVVSPGDPPVVGTVAFYDGSTLLGTVPVSGGIAALTVSSLTPGLHSFSAVFSGSSTSSASRASVSVSTDGPKVVGLSRFGFHFQSDGAVLDLRQPARSGPAQDLANYRIAARCGTRIAVASAEYDPATLTVTLRLAQRLDLHRVVHPHGGGCGSERVDRFQRHSAGRQREEPAGDQLRHDNHLEAAPRSPRRGPRSHLLEWSGPLVHREFQPLHREDRSGNPRRRPFHRPPHRLPAVRCCLPGENGGDRPAETHRNAPSGCSSVTGIKECVAADIGGEFPRVWQPKLTVTVRVCPIREIPPGPVHARATCFWNAYSE